MWLYEGISVFNMRKIEIYCKILSMNLKNKIDIWQNTHRGQSLITKRFKFKIVKNKKKNNSNFLHTQVMYLNSLFCPKAT